MPLELATSSRILSSTGQMRGTPAPPRVSLYLAISQGNDALQQLEPEASIVAQEASKAARGDHGQDDQALAARAIAGDEVAWEEIF